MNIPIRARKIMAVIIVITMVVSLSAFLPATPVYASSVWTVNDANDTAGSAANITLRYAMSNAQPGDIINFGDNIIGQCYYTTDGSDPRTSSTRIVYNGLIPVDQSGTIKAANHTSAGWSDVKTATFTIGGSDSPREPIIFPFEGNYSSAQTVYIYSPGADWLYYTTDGTDPGTSSTGTYFQGCFTSVTVSQTMTIRAIAGYGSGSSNIAEAHLSIGGTGPLTEPVITPNGGSYSSPLLVDISNRSGTIYLSSPLPKIDKDMTISGPGAESLAISGNYQTRIFEVLGGNVLISGLTIENGWIRGNTGFDGSPGIAGGGGGGGGAAEGGGGMLVKGGTITIDGVNFSNNQAIGGSGGNGGAGYTGEDDYGDGGNGAASDLIDGSTGGHGGIAPFSATDFGIFHLSDARPGAYAFDGFRFGGGGGGSGLNSNNEDTYHSVGGQGGQDVNGTIGVGPNGVGYNTNGSKGGNGGTGGYAHIESFNNSYYGGNGGNGGDAYGGALCLVSGAIQINNSSFTGNTVLGGTGGAGGISYQGFSNGQTLDSFIFSIGSTMLSGNRGEFESWWKLVDFGLSRVGNAFTYETKSSTAYPYGGYPGNGGNAEGGAIYLSPYNSSFGWSGAPLVMVNCTFNGNGAYGGYPGPVTNWTGVSGSFGQEFAADIANKTNSAHVDIRNVTGANSNLGDIRELSQPSVTWSEIEANNIKATCGTDVVTIQVNLRDSNSLAVWGEKVILNQGAGHSQISPSYAITDNNGNATFTVVGTKAETIEYTAICTSSNIAVSGKPFMLWDGSKNVPWTESRVIFSPGPPNAQTSTVSASHSTITADGVSEAIVTVNIADACGNILSGKQVTLNQGAGHSIITPATATTDNNGNATFTVTNVYDESVTYAASVGGITVSQTAAVTFSQYAWVVDNLGDGQSPGTLRYAVGNAPSGTTIVFKAGLSGSIDLYSPLPKINKDLIIDGSGANVAVNGKNLYRIFEINGGTVSIKGFTLINGRAEGNDGAYGGTSSQYGYGISGESGLSGLGGGLLITNGTVSVDNVDFINNTARGGDGGNGGIATGSGWTGGGGGTAGNGGIGQGGAIYLSNGSLSVTNSIFTDSSAIGGSGGTGGNGSCYGGEGGIGADGNGGAIYVNAGSLTISNIQFTNSSATGGNGGNGGGGGNTTAGEHGFGGGNGWGGALYINSGTFTATDCQFSGSAIAGGSLGTGNHGSIGSAGTAVGKDIFIKNCTTSLNSVTFSSDTNSYVNLTPADAGQSEITASPSSVFSNGTSKSTIKVTLRRTNGIPAPGKAVTLTAGNGSSSITSLNSITDNNGETIFTVSDRVGETVTYTARDATDNITVTKSASVTFLPPDANQSTITLNSASVLADGTEASTITVALKYSDGTPAIGKTVTLIPGSGSSHITSINNGITDNNGTAVFNVTDSQAETVVYSAKDITDNITVTQTAEVIFRPYDWKVTTLNDGNIIGTLRYAIQNAPIGTTITFQSGLAGTIVLTSPLPVINKDITIDGSDANVKISGNNQYRVFEVDSGNITFKDLTIADGKATGNAGTDMNYNWYDVVAVGNNGGNGTAGNGGGLLIMNGTVTVDGVTFIDNKAIGGRGGLGGNGPQVNTGGVGGTGGTGNGGAIFVNSGSLTIVNGRFSGNYAFGGNGGGGGYAHVNGGNGGIGGDGNGGAIFVDSGSLVITGSQFSGNGISGGNGGVGGQSGTVWGGSADGSIGAPGCATGNNLYNRNGTVQVSFVTISTENNSYYNLPSINTITYDSQGGSPISSIMNSASIAINAPADPILPGYAFGGWYKEPECTNAWNFSTDKVTGNITLYAKWTAIYSVTFYAPFSNAPPVMDNVLSGSTINRPTDPTRVGCTFAGWYKELEFINEWDFNTDMVTGHITLYAKWNYLPAYAVILYTQNGNIPVINYVYSGYTMSEPSAPTQFGYVFGGWYKEPGCINAWDFSTDTVTSEVCLYAKWTALPTYNVTFDSQEGIPALNTVSIYSGYTVSEPTAPTKSGNNFGGWYKEPGCINAWNFSTDTVTSEVRLYAKWTALPTYTVTFHAQGGSLVLSTNNVIIGSTISAPADPTQAGYIFGGWYKEQACTNVWNFGTDTVTSDITLYAKWTPIYTVTFDSQGGSQVTSVTDVTPSSTVSEPSAPTKAGYVFGGWYKEAACTNAWDFATDTVTSNIILYAKWTQTFIVTFKDWDGTILKTETVNEGSAATAPANPQRTGHTFTGWDKDFNNVTSDLTATALYTYSGGGGSSSNEIFTAPETPKTETSVSGNTVTSTTSTTAKIDNNGNATAEVTREQVSDAIDKAVAEAAKAGESTVANVEIKVTAPEDAKKVKISIPKAAVSEIGGNNISSLEVSTPIASISFDKDALDSISDASAGDIKITAAEIDSLLLPENTKQVVGDRPVYEFSVKSGDNTISQFDGTVRVSVPYTPKAGEDTNAIVIYYINAEGRLELVSNCAYDPVMGNITFVTSHFSRYAIGYNKVNFADVRADAWYYKAVDFIAARGITLGTGNGIFSPEAKLTRGEFIVMMMRAYGIAPDTNAKDNFADAGNTHFTGYLAAAKRLGISEGVGNNRFAPEKKITRQEMFTLMYNVLKVVADLPSGTSGKQLSSFTDTGLISSWAKDAMKLFVETGIISGNGGRLSPTSTSTRAELVQVLYILLSK